MFCKVPTNGCFCNSFTARYVIKNETLIWNILVDKLLFNQNHLLLASSWLDSLYNTDLFLLFCLFSNTTCWICGLYSIYVNKDLDMYERFLKIYVQMGSKWTHDFNRVYITFYFSISHFCSCRFCIKNKANTEALNIYYCFIPLLIYFVTTDLFQYYFLVPKNWLESLWVTLSFFIGNFENFHSNCFQKRLMVYILV